MGRGLDGYFFFIGTRSGWLCSFQAAARKGGLSRFPVATARGKHLFPFRTEQLSLSAPMVLGPQGPGRVGRRRFLDAPRAAHGRPVVVRPARGKMLRSRSVSRGGAGTHRNRPKAQAWHLRYL